MRDPDDLGYRDNERQPTPRLVQLNFPNHCVEYALGGLLRHKRQYDFLLRLDGDTKNRILLINPNSPAEKNGSASRARFDRCFENGLPPSFPHDGDNERGFAHVHSFPDAFHRMRRPSNITDIIGANAISATRPSPCTIGSCPPLDAAAPSASARRNVLASGPVATPPESMAIATNSLRLSQVSTNAST